MAATPMTPRFESSSYAGFNSVHTVPSCDCMAIENPNNHLSATQAEVPVRVELQMKCGHTATKS